MKKLEKSVLIVLFLLYYAFILLPWYSIKVVFSIIPLIILSYVKGVFYILISGINNILGGKY